METRKCPALLIGAAASHQGKTTVTAALAYHHRRYGRRVRVFKAGPDFLDPMILEYASGNPVHQLDLWMVGEQECRRLLFEAAGQADLILVEGAMGLYDGTPSSADLCERFEIPAVIVINASSMAQTFHAVAHGLVSYHQSISVAGVLANGLAGPRHAEMIASGASPDVLYLGGLLRKEDMALPERHLGLIQADEINDLEARLAAAASALSQTKLVNLLPPVEFAEPAHDQLPELLRGQHIAIARDTCFSFLYKANLLLLEAMGAKLTFFSPLNDTMLPDADSIYLPGGYPELFLDRLQENEAMKQAIKNHSQKGRSIYAECGGMLYLLESLADSSGRMARMVGLLPGAAVMQKHLAKLGYQQAQFPSGMLRGHTFHYSCAQLQLPPIGHAQHPHNGSAGEAIYCLPGLWASYLHLYFPSNPAAAACLFQSVQ